MTNLRKPLATLALASSALGLGLGVGLDPADAATHPGTAASTSSPSTSAASSHMAVTSLGRNTPDVADDWTVEWQIKSTTSSSSQPAVPSRSGSVGSLRSAKQRP